MTDEDDSFLKKMAHDLRSPISVVSGFISQKNTGHLSAEDEAAYLEAISGSVAKLSRIADAMLARAGVDVAPMPQPYVTAKSAAQNAYVACDTTLVVDDDAGIRRQWIQLLKNRGITVVTACNGEELLSGKIDFSKIQMAIVDYHYEGSDLNGYDVIEFLKRKKIARVHLCTANHQDPELPKKAFAAGADSIIPKPIDETVLTGLFNLAEIKNAKATLPAGKTSLDLIREMRS